MSTKYKTTLLAVFLAACMMIGLGQPAHAQLAAAGDVNPVTGFPFWFQDANLLSLGLCDQGGAVAEEPPCIPELANPALGFVQGNIVEALYYGATAVGDLPNGGSFLSICAVEAAGGALAGSETVSNVALIRIQDLPLVGDYTVTMPCGTFIVTVTDPVVDTDLRGENSTIGAPPAFGGTLLGPVQMFADNGTALPLFPGFLGDGITPGPLSGPLQTGGVTTFSIVGPGLNFTSDQFTVVGKVFALTPVVLADGQVTFNRDAAGNGTVDFLIPQVPGAVTAQAVGVESPLPGEPVLLTLANGAFTASLPITAATVLPNNVAITFNLGVPGDTSVDPQTLLPKPPQIFPLTVIPVGDLAQVTLTKAPLGGGTLDFLIPQSPGAVTAQAVGVGATLPGEPLVLTAAAGEFTGSVEIPANTPVPENVAVTFNLGVEGQLTEIFPVVTLAGSKLLLMLLPKIKKEQ